ncbi:unnamed protein product [Closterium sp. Yama58-4]|nr:unnamed protein product [Closterium sp. Yama58-4]
MARLHSSVQQHGLARFASLTVLALALLGTGGVFVSASAPIVPGKCIKSSLASLGYTNAVSLTNGLMLHWKNVSPTSINFALEAKAASKASKGWLSLGFSKDGKMTGADAVIGNLAGAKPINAYFMKSIALGDVKPTTKFTVTNAKMDVNPQRTIVKFTRSGSAGTVPVKYGAKNLLLWAFSADGKKALGPLNHSPSNRGVVSVNLGCKV